VEIEFHLIGPPCGCVGGAAVKPVAHRGYRRMLRALFKASVVAACFALAGSAFGQGAVRKLGPNLVEVKVTGAGMDKDEAVRDAMRKAVERGAGQFIYSRSKTKDFVLVKDTVLARAAGFIQSHEIIKAAAMEDGTWEVTIKAVVSIKGIEDTWGVVTTMLREVGRPKIMVFITEKIRGNRVADSTVQTRIENVLLESGFLLVNKEQLKAIDKKDLQAAAAEDSPARLQAVAKRFGAQLFITGAANAAAGAIRKVAGITLHTYEAEANVRCYRSDTAQLLSSIPGAPTRGADRVWRSAAKKALDFQGRQIAPRVREDILRFWQDALSGRGEVQLHVEGVTFRQYTAMKKTLGTVKQIKGVTGKYHNKVAEYSLQSEVNAETLAEKLLESIGSLEITDVSQNVIKARCAE